MLCLLLLYVLFCYWCYCRKRTMSLLKRSGIPGPKPDLILGNVHQMGNISEVDNQNALIKKYGKVVGYYTGAQPTILVNDVELIKKIQSLDFKTFTDRPHKDLNFLFYEKYHDGNLLSSTGERWKNTRKLVTPSFSPSKLKSMTPLIEESVDNFINILGKNAGKGVEFNFYTLVQRFIAELSIKTIFGIENNIDSSEKNEFFENIKEFTLTSINIELYLLVNIFPWLFRLMKPLRRTDLFSRKSVIMIYRYLHRSIKEKRYNLDSHKINILESLLESKLEEKDQKPGKRLNENEAIANALVIYFGGYDTTSNTLATLAHQFVNFPDVQENVRKEVKELLEENGELDFNGIDSKLLYLDSVIKETLRLYPPVVGGISRKCSQDYKYKDMTIPKGSTVIIAINSVHYDPDYWANPESFDPTRFKPQDGNENISFAFQSFGEGHRKCIGMRFAFLVIKFTFAKLLLQYRLERGPNTEFGKLETKMGLATFYPKNGIFVKAVKV